MIEIRYSYSGVGCGYRGITPGEILKLKTEKYFDEDMYNYMNYEEEEEEDEYYPENN